MQRKVMIPNMIYIYEVNSIVRATLTWHGLAYCVQLIKSKRTLNKTIFVVCLVFIALNKFFILYSIFQLKFNLKLVTGNSIKCHPIRSKALTVRNKKKKKRRYDEYGMWNEWKIFAFFRADTLSFCVRCGTIPLNRWIYPSTARPTNKTMKRPFSSGWTDKTNGEKNS